MYTIHVVLVCTCMLSVCTVCMSEGVQISKNVGLLMCEIVEIPL